MSKQKYAMTNTKLKKLSNCHIYNMCFIKKFQKKLQNFRDDRNKL